MAAAQIKTLGALNDELVLPVDGVAQVGISLETSAAWNGTITFQTSCREDPASGDWVNRNVVNVNGGAPIQTYTTANTFAMFLMPVGGLELVRVKVTAYVAGDVEVVMKPTSANCVISIMDELPAGDNQIGFVAAYGDIGHDVADGGASPPVKLGLRAIDLGANPTAVAAADRTNWYGLRAGIAFTLGGHMNAQTLRFTTTSAETNTALVTVSSGTRIVVTRITAVTSKATSVNVSILIGFHATTTPTTTGVVLAHPNAGAGEGIQEGNGGGILGIGGDGDDLRLTSSVPTGGALDIVMTYFTIATG